MLPSLPIAVVRLLYNKSTNTTMCCWDWRSKKKLLNQIFYFNCFITKNRNWTIYVVKWWDGQAQWDGNEQENNGLQVIIRRGGNVTFIQPVDRPDQNRSESDFLSVPGTVPWMNAAETGKRIRINSLLRNVEAAIRIPHIMAKEYIKNHLHWLTERKHQLEEAIRIWS